jgi:Dockerin type I domain
VPFGNVPPPSVHVTQVFVNGQGLTGQTSANGVAFRTLAGVDNTYGYAVPAGANQLKSIPWSNGINSVAIRFDQDVASQLQQGDLVIRGVNTANYTITNFSYDPATHTGVWTLSAPVTLDKLRLVLGAAGVAGLDGDWVNGADAYPSGDGTAGGDFNFRINVLRGDATQDGRVNALDLSFVKARLNKSATNPGTTGATYSPFADIVSDGTINAIDLSAVRARINNQLPPGEPAALAGLSITRDLFGSQPIA